MEPRRYGPVLFSIAIGIFIVSMLKTAGGQLTSLLVMFSFLYSLLLTYTGELLLRTFQVTGLKASTPTAFIAGFVLISVMIMALTMGLNLRAHSALLISAALIMIWRLITKSHHKTPSSDVRVEIFAVCFILAVIATFSHIPVSGPVILEKSGILPIWDDYFIHGETIAAFGSPLAQSANMELAGESPPFYHYVPFMLPAAFQLVSNMSGLALSTSLLLPVGLLVCMLGVYIFAAELNGRLGAIAAVVTILFLPAYDTFIRSGFFDFYWLLYIAPGTGYAIGVSFISCALLVKYSKEKEWSVLTLLLASLFSLVIIRIHMFILLAPVVGVAIALIHCGRRARIMISIILLIVIFFLFLASHVPALESRWINFSHPYDYLNLASKGMEFMGKPIAVAQPPIIQALLIFGAILGIYIVLLPLLSYINARQSGFSTIDALPYIFLLAFATLMLLSPVARNGDLSEYKHRHFPVLYCVFAVYTVNYGCRLVGRFTSECQLKFLILAFAGSLYIYALIFYQKINPASPDIQTMPWAEAQHNRSISPGTSDAAKYIRANSVKGDIAALPTTAIDGVLVNEAIEFISLSGVPVFLVRPSIKMDGSECIRKLVNRRLQVLNSASTAESWREARTILRSNGIRWFLISSKQNKLWNNSLKEAIYRSGNSAVYDAGSTRFNTIRKPEC